MIVRRDANEPFLIKWGPFFGLILLILTAYGSGVYGWAVLQRDFYHLRDNIINLQTPLSTVVLDLRNKVGEIERKQIEVRERLGIIERSGTTFGNAERAIIKRDIVGLESELSGMNMRCIDFNKRLEELQRKVIENDIMIKNIIEAINPHSEPQQKRGRK